MRWNLDLEVGLCRTSCFLFFLLHLKQVPIYFSRRGKWCNTKASHMCCGLLNLTKLSIGIKHISYLTDTGVTLLAALNVLVNTVYFALLPGISSFLFDTSSFWLSVVSIVYSLLLYHLCLSLSFAWSWWFLSDPDCHSYYCIKTKSSTNFIASTHFL